MENGRYDYSLAKSFGTVSVLCLDHLNPFNTDDCVSIISKSLDEVGFDPENDYLCMTGQTIILSITLAVISARHEKINVLLFDAATNMYKCRVFKAKGN